VVVELGEIYAAILNGRLLLRRFDFRHAARGLTEPNADQEERSAETVTLGK
jgi:hypothetical protein